MDLVVITPPDWRTWDPGLLGLLFEEGATRVHLRFPGIGREDQDRLVDGLPAEARPRLVLHQHVERARLHGIAWVHRKEGAPDPGAGELRVSAACHSLERLKELYTTVAAVLISPVFPSLSKPGLLPRVQDWGLQEMKARARGLGGRRARLCALGGIEERRLEACAQRGFDEVAVLGALWRSGTPRQVLRQLKRSLQELGACHA